MQIQNHPMVILARQFSGKIFHSNFVASLDERNPRVSHAWREMNIAPVDFSTKRVEGDHRLPLYSYTHNMYIWVFILAQTILGVGLPESVLLLLQSRGLCDRRVGDDFFVRLSLSPIFFSLQRLSAPSDGRHSRECGALGGGIGASSRQASPSICPE